MSDFDYEQSKAVDRQIREAAARGSFADNPLAGKPLPGEREPYREDWWLRDLIERENVGRAALPVPLALRREAQDLRQGLVEGRRARSEAELRAAIDDYDVRADKARRTPSAGPSVVIPRVETEEAVAVWRESGV